MTAATAPGRDRGTAATLVVLLVVAVALQATRDRLAPPREPEVPTLWLQSPDATRRLMLSFAELAADVYWMRAVVHYGGERRSTATTGRYALLYPLLDLTTTLDPHFDVAARMGAIFLSEGYPGGPGRPDQALQLLEKGLRTDPDRWQYRHDIGFVHYWWLKDYPAAAAQFDQASALPGAPLWLRTMAAVTLTKGGDRESARRLWSELLATADLDWLRDAATFRLRQLAALDDIDALTAHVARYRGRADLSWSLLVRAGALAAVPVDPTGVPYDLTPEGAVVLGAASTLAPLPEIESEAMTSDLSVLLIAAAFGLIVGSFLNVCIYRLPRGTSVVWPASACGSCQRELRWFENIPVLSWVVLGAKCARCKSPISVQYPLVEAVTAVLFVVVAATTPVGPLLAARLIFVCVLVVLFAIDLEHQILPNVITLPGIVVGLAFALAGPPGWRASLLGVLLGGGVLYAIAAGYYAVRKEEGLGMGDVKMLAMIGAFLGWQAVLLTLVLASFAGALIGLAMIAAQRGSMKYALPFGTFLALGALVAMLAGQPIIDWYVGFY